MSEEMKGLIDLGWFGKLETCPFCKNEIDPETCGCGSGQSGHPYDLGHNFVPMGCDCGRNRQAGAP